MIISHTWRWFKAKARENKQQAEETVIECGTQHTQALQNIS